MRDAPALVVEVTTEAETETEVAVWWRKSSRRSARGAGPRSRRREGSNDNRGHDGCYGGETPLL